MLIACEVFRPGLCSLLSRLVPEGAEASAPLPANLRVWADDARPLLSGLPDEALDRLFLLFPDPWPKARHAKRRFVHPSRVPEMARVLRSGAEWRIATDDPTYQAWVAEVFAAQDRFAVEGPWAERPEGWPPTRYEAKALASGRRPLVLGHAAAVARVRLRPAPFPPPRSPAPARPPRRRRSAARGSACARRRTR